jgi:hypothetical protein
MDGPSARILVERAFINREVGIILPPPDSLCLFAARPEPFGEKSEYLALQARRRLC